MYKNLVETWNEFPNDLSKLFKTYSTLIIVQIGYDCSVKKIYKFYRKL